MPSVVDCVELSDAAYYTAKDVSFDHNPPGAPLALTFAKGVASAQPGLLAASFTPALSGGFQRFQAAVLLATPQTGPSQASRHAWHRTGFRGYNKFGFFGALYTNQETGERVMAFRGTDDFLDGLVDDVAIAKGWLPPQALAALAMARTAGVDSKTYLTGHSLGGALAVIVASQTGAPGVTFNAPGASASCVASSGLAITTTGLRGFLEAVSRCYSNSRLENICIGGDVVSSYFTTGYQPGSRTELKATNCSSFDGWCKHRSVTCKAQVRSNPLYYNALAL